MHTALECEVTIKPRFVYIPSPRTGPVRGRACESRDGTGGREAAAGAATGGLRAGARVSAAAAGGGGEPASGSRGPARGAAGRRWGPAPLGPLRGSGHCGGCVGSPAAAVRGSRDPRQVPGARPQGGNGRHPPSSGPTEKARRGARERWRRLPGPRSGAWGERSATAGFVPGPRDAGRRGSGGKRPIGPPATGSAPRSSLGGVFGSPQAGEAAGGVMWKGLPVAPEKPRSRGGLSTWAELQKLGTWKPSRRRTPRHRSGRVVPPPQPHECLLQQ